MAKAKFHVYLAGPLFSQVQREWNRRLAQEVETLVPEVLFILPQDFKSAGKFNDKKSYPTLFKKCIKALDNCSVMVAILDGSDVDSGTSFLMGASFERKIPIVGVRSDYRPGADHGVNLMCSRSCKYIVREYSFQEDISLVVKSLARRLQMIIGK